MEGYAVYWNSKGRLFTEQPRETFIDSFKDGIPKKDVLPDGYEYCKLYNNYFFNFLIYLIK